MKTFVLLLCLSFASAAAAEDLTGNKFFKALEGKWVGKGSFTNATDDPQLARNKIEAKFSEDGAMFTIKGALKLGEDGTAFADTPFDYKWELIRSAVEGLYAGRFIILSGDGGEADYEVSIDETNLIARLNQISGPAGQNRFEITQKIEEENYIVNITQINSDGNTVSTGEIKFERDD